MVTRLCLDDNLYFLLGKLYVNELNRNGSFCLGKSNSIIELRAIGERLELSGVITNMILIDGKSKEIIWKSKHYDVRPSNGIHTEFYRWYIGVGYQPKERDTRYMDIDWMV